MAVETNDFRVVGVDKNTGEDVSVVIAAATKAAAEVKAEKRNIDTTHIVRLKRHDDPPAPEHHGYAMDAAQARSTTPTDKLIEAVVEPETPREKPTVVQTPPPAPVTSGPVVLSAITRPAYSAPTLSTTDKRPTATSAMLFVLTVLLGIAGGGYYVLVQEPNAANANDLLHPDQLFDAPASDAPATPPTRPQLNNPNAFGQRMTSPRTTPVVPPRNTPNHEPHTAPVAGSSGGPTLHLQSVVVSHEGRFAVINGKLIAQGGAIAGCTLLNVADGQALLENDGRQFIIRIETGNTGP